MMEAVHSNSNIIKTTKTKLLPMQCKKALEKAEKKRREARRKEKRFLWQ